MRLFVIVPLLACFLAGAAVVSAAVGPRVGVVVEGPDQPENWQAVLSAALSERPGLIVVERQELARLLEERGRRAVGTLDESPAPGLEGVQFYLLFRITRPGEGLVEVIEAGTGQVQASAPLDQATLDQAPQIAAVAEGALNEAVKGGLAGEGIRVAVLEAKGDDPRVFMLAARLRDALRQEKCQVLDRALTQELVEERNDAERGWRRDLPADALLGAQYFLELAPEGGECEIRVVLARDGRLLASRRFAFDGPEVINAIQPWLLPLLGEPAPAASNYLPTVEIEALEPFYRGLALFNDGRYAEATTEFTRAYLRNGKFRDAMEWEAKCYEALGLTPLAQAMRRYAEISLVGNCPTGSARTAPSEAIAFLGVSGEPAGARDALAAIVASALSADSSRPVRLPESLARLRREYDWLAGVSQTVGDRWEQAPSLFCRRVVRGEVEREEEGLRLTLITRDTMSGRILAEWRVPLAENPAAWPAQLADVLPRFLQSENAPAEASIPPSVAPESVPLEQQVLRGRGLEANAALLKLLLADPESSVGASHQLEKGQSKRDGLDAFLNFALRDWLISRLPEGSQRRWLELMRIYAFLETEPTGRLVTGERLDVEAALENFAVRNGTDAPGLAARYSLLFERQDQMDPRQLAEQCALLLEDLRKAGADELPGRNTVADMTASLRDFALVAAGDTNRPLPGGERKTLPNRIRVHWNAQGELDLGRQWTWTTNEHQWVTLSPEQKNVEAKAALAINGRKGDFFKVQDRWLTDFPRSLLLASFAAKSIHELNFWYGKPLLYAPDWEAERAAHLRIVAYVADALEYWAPRARNAQQLDQIENTLWGFCMALNERAFLGVVSDADYLALRDRLAAALEKANRSLGRSTAAWRNVRIKAWQEVTPEQARTLRRDHLGDVGMEVFDQSELMKEIAEAEKRAFAEGTFDPGPWWDCLRGHAISEAFTAKELARLYQKYTPHVLARFQNKPFAGRDQERFFEQGLALLHGGDTATAEIFFRKLLEPGGGLSSPVAESVRANAAFRLAQILRLNGRLPEAMEMAQMGLERCRSNSCFAVGRTIESDMKRNSEKSEVSGDLALHLVRLLAEMRFDPAKAQLPPRCGLVTVPTPNGDNPVLRVFFRQPPGSSETPKRVLVLVPSVNHDVLEYLQPESPWSRFADEHDLVLVCPQFYASIGIWREQNLFSYYPHAQVWSGQALLDALTAIDRKVALSTSGLLFHSYGAGAGFAGRFARWRPDLVAAVSANGGGSILPWLQVYPGLKPLTALRDVRFFASAGEDDDYAVNTQNRFAGAMAFVTALRGAKVDVEWKALTGVAHIPTPEMEDASRDFLRRNLSAHSP